MKIIIQQPISAMKKMQVVLLIALLVVTASAINGIGLSPIKPYHLNKGKLTKYLFSLATEEEIRSKAHIRVTFPAEFDQTAIASNPECMAKSDSYAWTPVPCVYSRGSVILNVGTIKDENMDILISSPRNPTLYSMSSYFELCLMFDNSVTNCKKEFGKVVFPSIPITTLSTATYPNVTSLSSAFVGKASTYQFNFTTASSYAAGNTIRVTMPPGYSTTANPVCQMTGTFNQVIRTFVWPDRRSIECQLVNKTISAAGAHEILRIIGIFNPSYAGVFGNTPNGFSIEILDGTTTAVLEEIYLQMQITILSGQMIGSILQQNRFIKAKSKYTFYLNLQNPLTSTDYIQIRMADSWLFYNDECSVVSGINLLPSSPLRCTNSTGSGFSYLRIFNFDSASITNQLVFNIYVGTPLTVGTQNVNIITANKFGVMDELTLSVSLNQTYGSLDMLSINAITANSKVPVAGTGPLELTFFLNYALPQTNVLTAGLFLLKIYPQIPKPPELVNGVLKCYFFNDMPARTCTWDTATSPLYTLVTIRTPETRSFQYSEIPITITTEGAISSDKIGITIDDKVTRYRFELAAYKQDSLVTPTEVYYSEYIADPILVPLTRCSSLTKQVNEQTALRIEFTNPYSFLNPLMNNIRLKVQFLAGGGWAANLGYQPNTIYKRFPCVFFDATPGYNAFDANVRCDLYTYLTGPHASLTSPAQRGPYILMYGFSYELLLSSNFRLELAKFLIGSTTGVAAKIRFSIIEETPTMLTQYIQLYYNELTVFTTVTQNTPAATLNTVTASMTSALINTNTFHTNTFTAPAISYAVTYQYDTESTPSFTNQFITCSTTNRCVYFGYPVNWIIEYHATNFPTAVSSYLSMQNGIYGGSYAGVARAYTTASLVIFKGTFSAVYSPRSIVTASFTRDASNTLYKGADVYYTIYFDTISSTPANGFIRFEFGGQVTLSTQPFCQSSSVGLYEAQHGLLCLNENSDRTLKIYNLAALSAGTRYTFRVRLKSDLGSGGTITPTVTIRTYYSMGVDYSVVDQRTNHAINTAQTNFYTIPNEFTVETPRVTQETPRVNYIGSFTVIFRSSTPSLAATKIRLDLPNHAWNSGFWTTPNGVATDPLVCFINQERVACTYTLSPLSVTMLASGILPGSDNRITITTEYLPENGIKHPSQAGEYISTLTFLDDVTPIESTSFYHRIVPQRLRRFTVWPAVVDTGAENMFSFELQVSSSAYPNPFNHATLYSRILIEFPTVDALGNSLFRADLGGYTRTGQYVGCYMFPYWGYYVSSTHVGDTYIESPSNNLKCRLIMSEVVGSPAVVEVLNFGGFDASRYRMRLRIAKIFNPTRPIVSVPITIRINHVDVATNNVFQLYYDTYDVFMNSQVNSPMASSTQNCNLNTADFTEDPKEVGDTGWVRFYPRRMDTSTSDWYYVIRLPADYVPVNIELSTPDCRSSQYRQCMIFPEIGYLIAYGISDSNRYVLFDVKLPLAVSQPSYNIPAQVWQGGRNKGQDIIVINSACQNDFIGTFPANPTVLPTTFDNIQHPNRRRFQLTVDFTLRHAVPEGGTIQIIWPATVTAAYPHCRSMVGLGSRLYARNGNNNGEIGCLVQLSRTWVLTEFAALPANSRVVIMGYVDIAGTSGTYLSVSQIFSYNGTNSNIFANGFIIDYYQNAVNSFLLYDYNSMNIDTEIMLEETLPLRVSYIGPLEFKFRLAAAFQGPNIGKINVRLPRRSVYGANGGFGYDNTKKIVCMIRDIVTFDEYGCIVTAVTDDTATDNENVLITMVSSSALTTSSTYTLRIKQHTGVDPEGLRFPTVPGVYKADVSFDVDGSNNFNIHDHLYLEVYGTPFLILSVRSFVTLCGQRNLLWVRLRPTTTIAMTDSIVVEIPTRSTLDWNLFANDLGTGVNDGADFPVDVISGFSNTFMKCRLFQGDQANAKPAKVVCGSFTSPITSTDTLFFAFKVVNPTLSPQVSIPLFIYSLNTNLMYKSNFNVVENAVYLRNTFLVSSYNDVGNFDTSTNQLQTQNTYLRMIARATVTTTNEDFYVYFFGFPLRNNGIITNGCKSPNGATNYGNAYYHENLYVIVCDFTVNNVGQPSGGGSVAQTIRIEGFYTPWYYLSNAEKQVYFYHLWSNEYTYRGYFTDEFPRLAPKTTTTAAFTMTALHNPSTMYKGARDDYTFTFSFSSSASVDISYSKLIALILPHSSNANYVILGRDCYEAPSSNMQIAECWMQPGTRLIWIRPVVKTSYTSSMVIAITTRNLAIQNPTHSSGTVTANMFIVKFYSYEGIAEPALDPINSNNYCFLIIDSLPSGTTWQYNSNPNVASVASTFAYFHIPHDRYYREIPFSALTHSAPFEFLFRPEVNFPTVSGGNFHQIRVTYGSIFTANSQIKIRDLDLFRPVCYLDNKRIRRCTIDTTNFQITMSFQFALAINSNYHVLFSLVDPRNPDVYGFLPTVAMSDIRVEYILSASPSTIYYTESQKFPTLLSLPTGTAQGPFRAFLAGAVQFGHTVENTLNLINMRLTFNRTDITGLVFQIPLRDGANNYLFSAATQANAFLGVEQGATYPCGNNGLSAGGNVKCILKLGNYGELTSPARIIMTDFTYTSQMNCRILITNPNSGAYLSIRVRAFGGTKSASNLYGDRYLGQWEFSNIFQATTSTSAIDSNSYNANSARDPSQAPWRNNTIVYVFSKNQVLNANRMSVAEVLTYDSGSSYTDKELGHVVLNPQSDDDDLLKYTRVVGSRIYRYAYFVRKWGTARNLGTSTGTGWDLQYLKLKFYADSIKALYFFTDTSIEVATNNFVPSSSYDLESSPNNTPLNTFYDQTERLSNRSPVRIVMEFDLTPMITALTSLAYRSNDNFVLGLNFNSAYWTTISSCQPLGGFVPTALNVLVSCSPSSANKINITNFKDFVRNPLLASTKNIIVKVMITVTGMSSVNSAARTVDIGLYPNLDSFTSNYQAINKQTVTLRDNCYNVVTGDGTCYVSYLNSAGSFQLQKVTDNFVQISFNPTSSIGFGGGNTYHYFDLAFNGFTFGTSCSVTNVRVEIASSNSPGTGVNNTVAPSSLICNQKQLRVTFENLVFANIWSGLSAAANDNTLATSEFIFIYFTIAPGASMDLPALHHEYIFATGTYTYYISSHTYAVRGGVSYLPTQALADSAAISFITENRNAVTEFVLDLDNLAVGVGSSTTGYILLLEFVGSTSWTSSNDPFSSYVNNVLNEQIIDCKCINAVGSVSITTVSPYVDAKCKRRLPTTSFNAFAITVDFDALAGEDVKCFFPEFKIFDGMVVQSEVKLVYGDAYVPDLTDGRQYGSVYRSLSNSRTFNNSVNDMSGVTNMGSFAQGINFYTSSVTVNSAYTGTYTLTGSWSTTLSTPYIYINFRKSGPVPVVAFCSDSNIYLECRAYRNNLNLVVARLKSTAVTSFSMNRGSMDITYPSSQWSDSASSFWNVVAYVGSGRWFHSREITRSQSSLVPVASNTFMVYPEVYGSNRATFRTTIIMSFSLAGRTLLTYADTKSMATITFSGIVTQSSNCQVWVQNQPSIELTCIAEAGKLTIYSERFDFTTNNLVYVSLGIVNPQVGSVSFNLRVFDYYYSDSRNSLVINRNAAYTIDNSFSTNVQFAKERVLILPFTSRFTTTSNVPLRVRFRPTSSIAYATTNSGYFTLQHSQIAFSGAFRCIFRQFSSFTNLNQQTEHDSAPAFSCTSSTDTLTIVPPRSMTISSSNYYELVIMPIGINVAGCTAGGCASQAGFHQVNFDLVNFIAYTTPVGPTIGNQQVQRLFRFEGQSRIALNQMYYLTNQPRETSLYFRFSFDFNSSASYPSHFVQFVFWDLPPSAFSGYSLKNQIPCQLSSTFTSIPARQAPSCVLSQADYVNGFVKVRIINMGPLLAGTFYWMSLDDIILPTPASSSGTQKFDLSILYRGPSNVHHQSLFREVLLIDNTGTITATSNAVTFTDPAIKQYGSSNVGSLSFTWPVDTTTTSISPASGSQSKIAFNFNGGFSATWPNINSVSFDSSGTWQLLWVNKKLNKFVFISPQRGTGALTVSINGIRNPFPFQRDAYQASSNNMEMNLYVDYVQRSFNTFNQPAFSIFTKAVPVVNIDQNLPSNSLNTYPVANRIGANAWALFRLGVVIEETAVNILARDLNVLNIEFTSGVNYLQECRAVRNSSLYVNSASLCQTKKVGANWHIYFYNFKESQLDRYWWLQVLAQFSSASIAYTSRLIASNGVVEYESTYPVSLSTYFFNTKTIPTTLSWLNRKYVYGFHQLQTRYLEAVPGQTTPYFKMRMTLPFGMDGSGDYFDIYVNSPSVFVSSTSTTNLICQLLPAVSGERDFSVGYYGECSRFAEGNGQIYYRLYGPVGGFIGDMDILLQISEPNAVTTRFSGPTSPAVLKMQFQINWNNGGGAYWDAADVFFTSYFNSVQILHTTTTVNDYDSLSITYSPKYAVSVGSSSSETVLTLDVSGMYHQFDGGISAIFAADGRSINSGARFSEVVSNPNNNEVCTVLFSQYSQKMAPLRFSLALQDAYAANTPYTWRIPLLKNPSTPFTALRYNLTLIRYDSPSNVGVVFSKHESINQYYTEADTSTAFSPTIINTNRNVQSSSSVDLSIGLNSLSVSQWDSVIFKLDNSQLGLIQSFATGNDSANYNYYFFKNINMVWAQKKTLNNVTTVGIGPSSSSLNYQRTFQFNWVKIHDSSNAPTAANPRTLRVGITSALTLNFLTTYSAATLTRIEGVQNQGSIAMYRLDLTVPIVPKGGEIRVLFNSSRIDSSAGGSCRVGNNFVRTTDEQVLRCFRIVGGYRITGFSTINSGTSVSLFFMMKSILALTAENITVEIYGIYGDTTSTIARRPDTVTVTHPAGSFPSLLYRFEQVRTILYSTVNSVNNYQALEGNINMRLGNLAPGDYFRILNPFSYLGSPRMLIKRNDSSTSEWVELILANYSGATHLTYTLPPSYQANLTLLPNTQYIWRLTTLDASYYNAATSNGYLIPYTGTYKFGFEELNSGSVNEASYYDYVPEPKPLVLTINNRYRAASRRTMLDFTFYMERDWNIGDWIEFTFDTHNLITNMFANDIEDRVVPGQTFRDLDCRQFGGPYITSGARITCTVYYGDSTANPPRPARLVIPVLRNYNFDTFPNTVGISVANVRNPNSAGMNVGVQMKILRPCENNFNKNCSFYAATGWYVTTNAAQNLQSSASTFLADSNTVLDTTLRHRLTFTSTASITTADVVLIEYPANFQGVMPSTCSATSFTCYAFPTPRWIVLIPTSTVVSGASSITISLNSFMNNAYYSQAFYEKILVTVSRGGGVTAADVYEITQPPFTTIKRSTSSGIATSMTIATTQTPNVWLRNYANTAIFSLDNIFMDSRIQAIYLVAPASDVTSWDADYCNATLTGASINTYPLRFTCRVFVEDAAKPVLQITPERTDLPQNGNFNTWDDLTLQVHAKFTISDFSASEPILYTSSPVTSGSFYAYGSVNSSSDDPKYFLSECSSTISISQHQVPIISDITFNQQSFAYRVARVNNKQVFYLLLKPTVALPITEMIFQIPVEFDYPGIFSHDNCFMIGRERTGQPLCKQSREGGQTLIKVTPQDYNNEVKIIQLGSSQQINWFTAPRLPGNFYNMTVELYGAGGALLEKQTINISPIYGEYFNIPDIVLDNIRDGSFAQSVYDLTFKTGTLQIPPGALTTATTLTSELQFIFENYNANIPSNVFQNDLRTSLADGSEVGCLIRSGIVALEGKRVMCILHLGTNSTDKPMITLLNYNYIDPGTTISISFGGIQSLNEVNVNTISIGVVVHYTDINSSTYLYMPTATLPDPTNNTLTTVNDRNSLGYDWHSTWSMAVAYSGNNIVRQGTTFSLSMWFPYYYPFGGFQYTSTGTLGDFVLLKFMPKHMIDPFNPLQISCAACTSVQVYYATGIVRFRHNITASYSYTWTFNNFPASAYALENQPVKVNVEVYRGYRIYAYRNVTLTGNTRTFVKCSLFTFGVLSVSSLNGGQIGVSYTFSLITNHYIPAKGAISITTPGEYGDMIANGVTCTLVGFVNTNAYCRILTPSRVDIYLNGTELSQTASYKVVLAGLQNPNQNSSSLMFYVSSYYDDNIYLQRKICENSVTPPAITVRAVRTCTLSWSASFVNRNFNASHTFVLSCNDLFRGDSIVYIRLPNELSSNNTASVVTCSSLESTTLVEPKCYLNSINGSFTLWTRLQATTQTSLSIVVSLVNPNNNTYASSATVLSKGVLYAQTPNSQLTILSTGYTIGSTSSVFLMNSPREAGLMATYIFRIAPIATYIPNNLAIEFPSNFFLASDGLSVGISSSEKSGLFSSLNYNNVQRLINNISAVDSVSLKAYPAFSVSGNWIFITNISAQLSTSEWTYVFIRGIKNSGSFVRANFTVAYYIDSVSFKTLQWILQAPLTYHISSPPEYLSIDSVQVSDYDLLYPAVYTFKFSGSGSNKIAIQGKQLSYIIVIPSFYGSTTASNRAMVCKFSELPNPSPCENYQSEIIVTETFPADYSTLTLTITTILNPALETYCDTKDVTLLEQTFFRIRIIEVVSNKFMFESSAVVDGSNCLKFESTRIPISLEHPLVMVAGLAYNITYGITKPASNLKIKAWTLTNGFSFQPDTVEFADYYTLKKTATIFLRSDIPPGNYTISFTKFESSVSTYFRNILPTSVQVLSPTASTFLRPSISIPSISVSTIGYPVTVPIHFSLPASTEMTLFIRILEESNQTLANYSSHLSNFTLGPRIINIVPQSNNFSFTISQGKPVVPPPLTLQFTLTSVYTIIHNLTTPTMTLCFDQDPTFNVLLPPLRVRLTEFASSCNVADVGKSVSNVLIGNASSDASLAKVRPEIISIRSSNVRSTGATITINTRTPGTVYYLVLDAGYPAITSAEAIIAMNNTQGFTGTGEATAQNVYTNTIAQINSVVSLQLSKLSSLTTYTFYAVEKSELGTSDIRTVQFKTVSLSKGVLMKLTFNTVVASLDIVKSLERIMRITPLRIKVLTSTLDLNMININVNQFRNNPKFVYEVVIAPDPTNDTLTPLSIVQSFLASNSSRSSFSSYLPSWDNTTPVQYYELRAVKPKVTAMPQPRVINLYNATFEIKFWERSNVYAVLVEQPEKANDTMSIAEKQITARRVSALTAEEKARSPSSLQIRNGQNIDNSPVSVYAKFSSMTDAKGAGTIFFDDLKPGSVYELFITSSSYLPYEPTLLWDNSEVIRIRFETLHNPNLMKSQRHIDELKKYQPALGSAIERFLQNQQKKDNRATSQS